MLLFKTFSTLKNNYFQTSGLTMLKCYSIFTQIVKCIINSAKIVWLKEEASENICEYKPIA